MIIFNKWILWVKLLTKIFCFLPFFWIKNKWWLECSAKLKRLSWCRLFGRRGGKLTGSYASWPLWACSLIWATISIRTRSCRTIATRPSGPTANRYCCTNAIATIEKRKVSLTFWRSWSSWCHLPVCVSTLESSATSGGTVRSCSRGQSWLSRSLS